MELTALNFKVTAVIIRPQDERSAIFPCYDLLAHPQANLLIIHLTYINVESRILGDIESKKLGTIIKVL